MPAVRHVCPAQTGYMTGGATSTPRILNLLGDGGAGARETAGRDNIGLRDHIFLGIIAPG